CCRRCMRGTIGCCTLPTGWRCWDFRRPDRPARCHAQYNDSSSPCCGALPMRLPRLCTLTVTLLITLPSATVVMADEGMWTHDNYPVSRVRQQHGVGLTPDWLEQVRLATVRLANCTASFVSAEGLMLTNHHCIAPCLAQLFRPGEAR